MLLRLSTDNRAAAEKWLACLERTGLRLLGPDEHVPVAGSREEPAYSSSSSMVSPRAATSPDKRQQDRQVAGAAAGSSRGISSSSRLPASVEGIALHSLHTGGGSHLCHFVWTDWQQSGGSVSVTVFVVSFMCVCSAWRAVHLHIQECPTQPHMLQHLMHPETSVAC